MLRFHVLSRTAVLLFIAASLAACKGSKCDAGSTEVNGQCMALNQSPNVAAGAPSAGAPSSGAAGAGASSSGTTGAGADVNTGAPAGAGAGVSSGASGTMAMSAPLLANGARCERAEQCQEGFCKNAVNGTGICCSARDDCCATEADCPEAYRRAPVCTDVNACRGTKTVAMCDANRCSSQVVASDDACDGMAGPGCGLYRDVTCKAGQNNTCPNTCTNANNCDDDAFCDGGECLEKRPAGGKCTDSSQCSTGNCQNSVCCGMGDECCTQVSQCTKGLEATCDQVEFCQGTARTATCADNRCVYGARVDDDTACVDGLPGAALCGPYRDLMCIGMKEQGCYTKCENNDNYYCDMQHMCVNAVCVPRGSVAAAGSGG